MPLSRTLGDNDLKEILNLVLKELQNKKILQNVPDPEALIEATVENIIGELKGKSPAVLDDPAMKLKLATALIATFTYGKDAQNKFEFQQLFKTGLEPEQTALLTLDYFNKLAVENEQSLVQQAKAFINLITPRPEPGAKPKEDEKDEFVTPALYDDTGHVIETLGGAGISKNDMWKAVITLSEMLCENLDVENSNELSEFLGDTQKAFHAAGVNSTAPKLGH